MMPKMQINGKKTFHEPTPRAKIWVFFRWNCFSTKLQKIGDVWKQLIP
jgi:hypothetical protein